MAYLGEYDRPSTYRVACDGCAKVVRGKEPPKGWVIDTDPIPFRHYCPKCKPAPAKRPQKGARRG